MDRTKGIGGTDVAALVGLSRYKSPFDVWLEKTGQAPPREETLPMKLGKRMEPLLSELYAEETGIMPDILDPPMLSLRDKPWHCGSPDRTVPIKGGMKVLELKTAGERQAFLWGDPGTDEVPKDYFIQTMWYMPLIGTDQAEIAALIGNRKFAIYKITLDIEIMAFLEEEAERFWVDHVLANKPPEIGATEGARNWLRKMYPQDQGAMLEPTDEHVLATIKAYRDNRASLKAYETAVELLENQIKAFVGTNAGAQGEWGRITWKRAKDSVKTDWKVAFDQLMLWVSDAYGAEESIRKQNEAVDFSTSIKPGSRRFLAKFQED